MSSFTMAFYKGIRDIFPRQREGIDRAIEEASYVVMDTELTGLDLKRDSIISIGAVRMSGPGIDLGMTYHRLARPTTSLNPESIVVHGITPSELLHNPPIEEVIKEFLDFCGTDIIVGHFISIDRHFLNREVKRLYGNKLHNPFIDTSVIYRWIKGSSDSFSSHYDGALSNKDLFSIAREFGISVKDGHNALSDAFITAQIFQRFLRILPGLGVRRVKELLRIGRP